MEMIRRDTPLHMKTRFQTLIKIEKNMLLSFTFQIIASQNTITERIHKGPQVFMWVTFLQLFLSNTALKKFFQKLKI